MGKVIVLWKIHSSFSSHEHANVDDAVADLLQSQCDQPHSYLTVREISREISIFLTNVLNFVHVLTKILLVFFRTRCTVSFSYINILQGSVATQLRCGEIFSSRFIANCVQNATVKQF